jgi:hypothetical protein
MTADNIIPMRPAAAPVIPLRPPPPVGQSASQLELARACARDMFDRRERAILEAMEQGDLRRAIVHFAGLVAPDLGPLGANLSQEREARAAVLLDHIEQAARCHFRDAADKDAP